jgi:hypothetical protein
MATTTTNYGWDIPQSTDLVKDGATAIATLGQDIDTSVYTALGGNKSGLVLLNTTSFSGVASTALTADTFTSTYTNYRIIFTGVYGSVLSAAFRFRLRKAGVDNTGATSYRRRGYFAGGSLGITGTNESYYEVTYVNTSSTAPTSGVIEIYQPKESQQTLFYTSFYDSNSEQVLCNSGRHIEVDTYDSMNFLIGSGNMTGTYSVYGYNK